MRAVIALLALTAACSAQAAPPPNLLARVASLNEPLLREARVASAQARDARVREYAGLLLDDHGQLSERLAVLAPAGATPAATGAAAQDAGGARFDRNFLDAQVKSHQALLSLLSPDAAAGDAGLATFAKEQRGVEDGHLQRARALRAALEQPLAAAPAEDPATPQTPRNTVGPGNSAGGGHGYGPADANPGK